MFRSSSNTEIRLASLGLRGGFKSIYILAFLIFLPFFRFFLVLLEFLVLCSSFGIVLFFSSSLSPPSICITTCAGNDVKTGSGTVEDTDSEFGAGSDFCAKSRCGR